MPGVTAASVTGAEASRVNPAGITIARASSVTEAVRRRAGALVRSLAPEPDASLETASPPTGDD